MNFKNSNRDLKRLSPLKHLRCPIRWIGPYSPTQGKLSVKDREISKGSSLGWTRAKLISSMTKKKNKAIDNNTGHFAKHSPNNVQG